MIKSNTTFDHIKLSSNVNDDEQTLYTGCKVNSHFLLFQDVNNRLAVAEGHYDLTLNANDTLKNYIDVLNQGRTKGNTVQAIMSWYKPIEEKRLNWVCKRIYGYFSPECPITHVAWTPTIIPLTSPDALRIESKRAMKHSGVERGVIFGIDRSKEGSFHFHSLIQGYLKRYGQVLQRTGWSYHRFDGDRSDYLNDFVPTVRYCLEKPYANKRAYIRI